MPPALDVKADVAAASSGSDQCPSAAAWASPATKSSAAAACAIRVSVSRDAIAAADSSVNTACSARLAWADASSSAAAKLSSSGVLKRVDEASPWRSVNPGPSACALDAGTSTWWPMTEFTRMRSD